MNRSIHFRASDVWIEKASNRAKSLGLDLSEYIRSTISKDCEEGKKMTIQYWQLTSGDIFAIKMVNGEFTEACGPLHHKDVTLKNLEEENFEFETEDIDWLNSEYEKGNLKLKKIEEE